MKLSRLDLDGTGSPGGLVSRILKAVPDLPIPVPLEELCAALDIIRIEQLDTDGFEGALITDTSKCSGIILTARNASHRRRRFSIAHELGHFLIPTHMPDAGERVLCSHEDMRRIDARDGDRRSKWEIQANQFAAMMLMPPPALRPELQRRRPDVAHLVDLASRFDVSKDAMARAYADNHPEPVAIVVARHGRVLRIYRNKHKFPFVAIGLGEPLPRSLGSDLANAAAGAISQMDECDPEEWIDRPVSHGVGALSEQIMSQRDGYALVLLSAEIDDCPEVVEEADVAESWRPSFR